MRDLALLVLHLLTTIARLVGPGGARSVVAESVLLKQHLLILDRTRKRAPNLRLTDRVLCDNSIDVPMRPRGSRTSTGRRVARDTSRGLIRSPSPAPR